MNLPVMRPIYSNIVEKKKLLYLIFTQAFMFRKILETDQKIFSIIKNINYHNLSFWDKIDSEFSSTPLPKDFYYTWNQPLLKKYICSKFGNHIVIFTLENLKHTILRLASKLIDPLNNQLICCDITLQEIFQKKIIYIPHLDDMLKLLVIKLPNSIQLILNKKKLDQKKFCNQLLPAINFTTNDTPTKKNEEIEQIISPKRFKHSIGPYQNCTSVSLIKFNNHIVIWSDDMSHDSKIFTDFRSCFFIEKSLRQILQNAIGFDKNNIVFKLNEIYNIIVSYVKERKLEIYDNIVNISNDPLKQIFNTHGFHFDQIPVIVKPHLIFAGISTFDDSLVLAKYIPFVNLVDNPYL